MVFVLPSLAGLALLHSVYAATAPVFAPAAKAPTASMVYTSTNYTGASNSTIVNGPVVPGASFDRFIQIWLENTDYATAASAPAFKALAQKGVLLNGYYGATHPSEPNYMAAVAGTFYGLGGDNYNAVPKNASTMVDLLEAKNISWSSYQENMPYDGYTGFEYSSANYGNTSAPPYTYYLRKHNPLIMHDSVASVASRALRVRNFNDFAVDVNANAMSQWTFITPNMVNDAHDTDIEYCSSWIESWLVPLLSNPNFNNNRTIILLTFDEAETYSANNQVYTLILGGGVPAAMVNTTDSTYYTHYTALSTVQANWGLGNLGNADTNNTLNNVLSWVAKATGWTNNALTATSANLPLTNATKTITGALNPNQWVPILAPNPASMGAGKGPLFVSPYINTSLTTYPVTNLTALGLTNPYTVSPGYDYSTGSLVIDSPSEASSAAGYTATGGASTASGVAASGASPTAKSSANSNAVVVLTPLAAVMAMLAALVV